MIPPKTDPCWKDLVTGKCSVKFKMAALSMCVARNQREVMRDPTSVDKCVDEIYLFCTKFEKLVEQDLVDGFNLVRM